MDAHRIFGDASYLGIRKHNEHKDREGVDWLIAKRPSQGRKLNADKASAETLRARARVKVEHAFRYIERVFGYDKVRYRGLAKNDTRLHLLAAFSNLFIGEKFVLA